VRHSPTLVKVNADEARTATGDAADPLAALAAMGARSVVITTGGTEADWLDLDGRRHAVRHDPIPGALPVGSGDAFLAGLAARLLDAPLSEAGLRFAAAAARANARQLPAGDITAESVRAELPSVRVQKVP
jgi:fructose-1-phosphate kinase PfkB-like protein